jgi:hypothetical protein
LVPEGSEAAVSKPNYSPAMHTFTRWTLLLALACPGCEEDDDGNDDGADPSTSSTGTGTGTQTGSADPTGEQGSEAESAASSGSSAQCEPDPADDECNACTKAECCEELGACFADPICECMTGCATGLNDIPMCTDMCGQSNAFSGLTSCVTVNCAAECI